MPYVLVTPPTAEPVTLGEAKAHLRVDTTDDDALISMLLSAAREHAENLTQRQLVTATWKLILDAFPGPSLMGIPAGEPFTLPGHAILINKSPVSSITSIQYLDMGGTLQTMPSTNYVAELSSEPARITPVFGQIWQPTLPQIGAVQVTFTTGYGVPVIDGSGNRTGWTGQAVPEGIRRWILLRAGSLYQHREEMAVLPFGKIEPLPFIDSLLDPYKVVLY